MRVTVLGAKGMLGRDLLAACSRAGIEASGYDLPEIDITCETSGLDDLPDCDWAVNCAAYTDVDGAETDRETAFAVNAEGAGRVAAWCGRRTIALVHVSTDYVFDGSGSSPYGEDDPVRPLNVYGESKLAGEQAVAAATADSIIVRTQSLFGVHGKNFVRAIMARLESAPDPLRVVDDQTSCPTFTGHLSDAILRLLDGAHRGIVHVSASGHCTWFDFARAIVERVKPGAVVHPVTSSEFARPARRPAYSVLDKARYASWTAHEPPTWQDGLDRYLQELRP